MPSNTKKLARNSLTSLLFQVVLLISGLLLPRYIMECYGSLTFGLVSSISQFLGLITLTELGIGAVIQSSLYKPLVENDNKTISKVFASSQKFFTRISIFIVAYVIVLIFVYPLFIDDSFDFLLTAGLILSISITYIFQYLFGITNQLLLDADQEVSVEIVPQIVATIVSTLISIFLMKQGCSIVQVKAASALVFFARPIYLSWYVKKHYHIDRNITFTEEPIKQKWNGIAQHIANVILRNTSPVVLTMFANLQYVAIYAVYSMVIKTFSQAIESTSISLTSFLGIKVAESSNEESNRIFDVVEFFFHNIMTLLFTLIAILIIPFIKVYTMGIEDADYIQPIFSVLFVLGFYIYNIRTPYHLIIKAAGHYKETQKSAIVEAIVNVVVTMSLVMFSPLIAVTVGFLVAMLYRTIYYIYYLRDNILCRKIQIFIKNCVTDTVLLLSILLIALLFDSTSINGYFSWVLYATKLTVTSIILDSVFCAVFYRKYIIGFSRMIKNKFN